MGRLGKKNGTRKPRVNLKKMKPNILSLLPTSTIRGEAADYRGLRSKVIKTQPFPSARDLEAVKPLIGIITIDHPSEKGQTTASEGLQALGIPVSHRGLMFCDFPVTVVA